MTAPSLPTLLVSHWLLAWPLDAIAAVYMLLYGWAASRVRGRWPLSRTISFLAGIVCVLIAVQSGVERFDDRLLSVHMVQHMLLLLVAPLLLLGARPMILTLRALPVRHRMTLVRVLHRLRELMRPIPCLACFAAAVLLTHLPSFYGATLHDPALHDLEHGLYLLAGLLLWLPIMDADPVPAQRLGAIGRLVYVLGAMLPMALVGAYLNRHASLVYPAYGPPARALGASAVVDQQQAGAIMWVASSMIMVIVGLWASITALVAEERRQRGRDAHAPQPLAIPDPIVPGTQPR